MEIRPVLRPLSRSLAHASSPCIARTHALPSIASQRHQSTTARTKRMLKIAPHPDFLAPQSGSNHIIYNPPAAAPSVYHTPFKFLPKSDPRRRANLTTMINRAGDSSRPMATGLPPVMDSYDANFNKYTMTLEQVQEMRALRLKNPMKWGVLALAEKFNCSPMFVMKSCKTSAEYKASETERLDAIRARWSPAKAKAKDERKKRQVLLLRGAL